MTEKPTFTFREKMTADESYVQWMADIKQRFRQSQVKASVHVNTAMLEFYWSLGRDIVELRAESKWGNGFFNQLSLDLKTAFPNETGFSVTNLKYMKRWYAFYSDRVAIRHQAGDEFNVALAPKTGDKQDVVIRQQVADELSAAIRQQPADELGAAICQHLADEKSHQVGDRIKGVGKGQQAADQLEALKKANESLTN